MRMALSSSPLRVRVAVGRVVELRQPRVDVGLEVTQPSPVDLVVQHGVAGRALLHELGEDAGLVRGQPLVGHLGKEPLAHRLALPERDDLRLIDLPGLGADLERDLLARIQDVQVGQGVAAELGIGGRGLGRRPLLADDQLAVADGDRAVLHHIAKRQRPAHRRGEQAVVQAVGFGHQHGALGRDGRDGVQALLAECGDAGGDHGISPTQSYFCARIIDSTAREVVEYDGHRSLRRGTGLQGNHRRLL